jgi:hypothetical protein
VSAAPRKRRSEPGWRTAWQPGGPAGSRQPGTAGLQAAIYNPDIDADGSNGRGLAATLREALAASADA